MFRVPVNSPAARAGLTVYVAASRLAPFGDPRGALDFTYDLRRAFVFAQS